MSEPRIIRIVLADDHSMVRAALQQWLMSIPDFEVVGVAANGNEAVEVACRTLPDIVLMDLSMPELDGVAATAEIIRRAPQVAVIALTTTLDLQRVNAALAAGAMGYLLKDVEPEVLAADVRSVVHGGLALNPAVAAGLFKTSRTPHSLLASLTAREQQILRMIASGMANKQISRALGISDKTVKAHCGRIFQRLGVHDRTQAAIWAIRVMGPIGDQPSPGDAD